MKIKILLLMVLFVFSFNAAFADTVEGIVTTYNCGDGNCTAGESCSNCPGDCGECATSSSTIQITTSSLGTTIKAGNISIFVPTQPPLTMGAEDAEEGLPVLTGVLVSPSSKQTVPLNVSIAVLVGLIFAFLLLRYRPSIKK